MRFGNLGMEDLSDECVDCMLEEVLVLNVKCARALVYVETG